MPARRGRMLAAGASLTLVVALAAAIAPAGGAVAAESPSPSPSASASTDDALTAEPVDNTADESASPSPTSDADTGTGEEGVTDNRLTQSQIRDQLGIDIARQIDYGSTATAVGTDGLATVSLAIPKGLVPVLLQGDLLSVADNPGTVRIRVGANYITMDATKGGPWSLQIPFAAIENNQITVEVRNTLDLPDEKCAFDTTTTETIKNLQLSFIGHETPPTTIAGFFSPPVQRVTVVAPTGDLETTEATLSAAAALARRYEQEIPITVMDPEKFADDPSLLVDEDGPNRIVALEPNDDADVSVTIDNPGVPRLTISGPSEKLGAAAAALDSLGLGLAAVPNATQLSETGTSAPVATLTLADLGAPMPTMSGLGRLTYVIPVRQDVFGGPIQGATVHLEGVHTPVPEGATATTSILWNDEMVSSSLMADGDQYSADVSISPSLMRRDNFLTIRVDAISRSGSCESGAVAQAFQIDIDGKASTITGDPGQSLIPGFTRFPQSFGSDLHVAFGSTAITSSAIESAADLVMSLQRASSAPLTVSCEDFATFVTASYPGLVVGATPDDADALKAPLRFEPWRTVSIDLNEFTVTVDGPFAALEGFTNAGRDIVMLGGTDPASQSESLQRTLADEALTGEFGWFGLNGTVLVAQPNNAPLVSLGAGDLVPQATTIQESRQLPLWWLIAIGVVLLILLARLVTVLRRRRRVKRAVAESEQKKAANGEFGSSGGRTEGSSAEGP